MKNKIKEFLIEENVDFKILFPEITNSQLEKELKKYFNQIGGNFKISGKKVENSFFVVKKGILEFKIRDKSKILDDLSRERFVPNTVRDFALLHDTHNNKTDVNNGIHLLTRKVVMRNKYEFGAIYFKDEYYKIFEKKERLIIIENKKIFDMLDLRSFFKYFKVNNIEDDDLVIFGAGDLINSKKINQRFFKQFENILYFGDYDDEGYDIFKLLSRDHSNMKFIIPIEEEAKKVFSDMKRVGNKEGLLKKGSIIRELLGYNYEIQQECFYEEKKENRCLEKKY